jgi:hypothetical protein
MDNNNNVEKAWVRFFPQQSKFNGISTKGHHLGWGKYLGTLAIMIDYLKACGLDEEYEKYRSVVKDRWDRWDRLSQKEINEMKKEVLSLLPVDVQRKFTIRPGVYTK